jgi:hypothetical protein
MTLSAAAQNGHCEVWRAAIAEDCVVVRARDLKPPRDISPADFEAICEAYGLRNRELLRRLLDELVKEFDRVMEAEKLTPDRNADIDQLKKALKSIRSARAHITRVGPAGVDALGSAANRISPMVHSAWLQTRFPDDSLVPGDLQLNRDAFDRNRHPALKQNPLTELAARDKQQRWYFVRYRAPKTIAAICSEIEGSLEIGLRDLLAQPGGRGGRQPLTNRHYLLINLAEFWSLQGNKVRTTENSAFASFCDAVCEAMGWPLEGLSAAIPDAVRSWRNLSAKKAR